MTTQNFQEIFTTVAGKPKFLGCNTTLAVRGAAFRVSLLSQQYPLTILRDRVPASRLALTLKRPAKHYAHAAGLQGFALVKACRPTELDRVWIMPLGHIRARTVDIVEEYRGLIQRGLDAIIGRNVNVERRIISTPDAIEEEVGVASQRRMWQATRERCPFVCRSSQGSVIVAVHEEIMQIVKHAKTQDEALHRRMLVCRDGRGQDGSPPHGRDRRAVLPSTRCRGLIHDDAPAAVVALHGRCQAD
jgi:hypothetical protein